MAQRRAPVSRSVPQRIRKQSVVSYTVNANRNTFRFTKYTANDTTNDTINDTRRTIKIGNQRRYFRVSSLFEKQFSTRRSTIARNVEKYLTNNRRKVTAYEKRYDRHRLGHREGDTVRDNVSRRRTLKVIGDCLRKIIIRVDTYIRTRYVRRDLRSRRGCIKPRYCLFANAPSRLRDLLVDIQASSPRVVVTTTGKKSFDTHRAREIRR